MEVLKLRSLSGNEEGEKDRFIWTFSFTQIRRDIYLDCLGVGTCGIVNALVACD